MLEIKVFLSKSMLVTSMKLMTRENRWQVISKIEIEHRCNLAMKPLFDIISCKCLKRVYGKNCRRNRL